ncbi:hypothetical protein XM38_005850 [Halomicronema hongdechloris C2206]|uniref:DUF3727 domain-containing protein n=1 Tax=Halomicronema hongdechloris C2206 TaxID=1641165 RepID=A0A1Z3HH88_9CYAN|nr:hypothetical protein XM38_005850 [Halomicronema hongdechloris C2206]
MEDDVNEAYDEQVLLMDEDGRSLPCSIEQTFDVDGQRYLLLLPVDAPIEIFVWRQSDGDEVLMDVEEEDIDTLFPTARAVLAEQNLTLQHTAITLTAAGEIPEANDDDCLTLELDEWGTALDGATEDFQILATFFHQDEEYTICTPSDPLLICAHRNAWGQMEIVSPEEFQRIRTQLEDKLFDVLD